MIGFGRGPGVAFPVGGSGAALFVNLGRFFVGGWLLVAEGAVAGVPCRDTPPPPAVVALTRHFPSRGHNNPPSFLFRLIVARKKKKKENIVTDCLLP